MTRNELKWDAPAKAAPPVKWTAAWAMRSAFRTSPWVCPLRMRWHLPAVVAGVRSARMSVTLFFVPPVVRVMDQPHDWERGRVADFLQLRVGLHLPQVGEAHPKLVLVVVPLAEPGGVHSNEADDSCLLNE